MNMIDTSAADPYPWMERNDAPPSPGVGRLLRKVRRGLPFIGLCLVAGLAAGCMLLREVKPGYTSSLSILIDPKDPGAIGAGTEFASVFVDASKIGSVEVVLLSSRVLQHVITAEHLADLPGFGDAHPSLVDRLVLGRSASNTAQARETRAMERLRRMITTNRVGGTYVIQVDVTAESAAQAQRLGAALADAYLTNMEETRQDSIRRDSRWLTDRLNDQRGQLIQSEGAVEALRKKFHLVGSENGLDTSTDRQSVSRINESLAAAQEDVAASQAAYDQAQEILRTGGNIEGMPDIVGSKVIGELRAKQADASRRVADLSLQYTKDYLPLQHAEEDRNTINRQVSLEVSRVVASLRYKFNTAVAHRDALAKQLNKLIGVVNEGDNAQGRVELREAERVAEANRTAYDASLKRLREVQPQQSRQDLEARVISGPDLPERPSSPKPMLFIGAGGVLGLLAGVGLLMVLPFGRERVGDSDAAERDLLLPILSMTPYLTRRLLATGGRTLSIPDYVAANPFSIFAEGLKRLRLRLRSSPRNGGQIVQVTSAISREGKSTIAASLAVSAAASGVRAVLVDLDLHQPAAGLMLSNDPGPGIVDVLLGDANLESVVQCQSGFPVRVIQAGCIANLRPGMIESAQLGDLIRRLAKEYDLVVVDTPPVLSVSDPLYISALVDATIVVVAWRETPQAYVDEAVRALRSAGAPVAGLVLNKVSRTQNDPSGSFYHDKRYVTA